MLSWLVVLHLENLAMICKLERRAQDSDTCNIFAEVAEPKLSLADANPSLVQLQHENYNIIKL